MELQFTEKNHEYKSIKGPVIKWTSVTTVIGLYKEKFDQKAVSKAVVKKKKSKWFGMKPEDVVAIWNGETTRALKMGTWYHNSRENEVIACDTIRRAGIDLPIMRPIEQDGIKISPDQRLVPGIYPEHFMYLKSTGVCGQADRVEVIQDVVDVYDYKTNKEIKTKGFTNWNGVTKMMLAPLNHLEDCNLAHYTIQLSIYMYMILKHNPGLKPGKLVIQHVKFEIEELDKNGYPVIATDPAGEPIVEKLVNYEVPYLEKEVMIIMKHYKTKA